eukprot:10117202-Prorocentrum_lima.AAC.1
MVESFFLTSYLQNWKSIHSAKHVQTSTRNGSWTKTLKEAAKKTLRDVQAAIGQGAVGAELQKIKQAASRAFREIGKSRLQTEFVEAARSNNWKKWK